MNRISIFLSFALLLTSFSLFAQPGSNDMSFNPNDVGFGQGDGAVNPINCAIIQPDGKVLIGGSFLTYNNTSLGKIARIDENGLIDNSFNTGSGVNNTVTSMALQPDGKIIIAGNFTTYNGVPKSKIARLNSDGTLDASFTLGVTAPNTIVKIALQSDGKIIMKGDNGVLTRLNANGTNDNTFSGSVVNDVKSIVVQPDGKIILGGNFFAYGVTNRNRIIRLNSDGSVDNTLNIGTGMNAVVNSISLQPDGKIIVGGDFTSYNGNTANKLIRLNSDGSVDNSFNIGSGASSTILATKIQSDGKILISGFFSSFNTSSVLCVARINTDGSLDPSFNAVNSDMTIPINDMDIQADGKVIIAGNFQSFDHDPIRGLARLNVNGTLDTTFNFNTSFNHYVYSCAIQPDSKIIVGGEFSSYDEVPINMIARLNPDGALDNTFVVGSGFNGAAKIVCLQPDGKILVGGDFSTYNGATANKLIRLNTDGSIDNTFNTNSDGYIRTICLQPDGKILVGGLFITINGVSSNRIVRLNPDGSTDNTFNVGTGADNWVYSIAIQPDGKILVGGLFSSYNGTSAGKIVRLNTNGTVDNTFITSGANNTVFVVKLQPDGKILVGGLFTYFNGSLISGITRLHSNGSIDNSFNPSETGATGGEVRTIQLQPNGNFFMGGYFTTYNGTSCNYFTSLTSTGQIDNSYNFGSGANNPIWYSEILSNGRILVGGGFTAFNGVGRNRMTRILNCTPSSSTQTISSCDTYFWAETGQTYSNSGQFTHVIPNSGGCDSTITLDLTINYSNTVTDIQTACDSYDWIDGNTYTSSTNTPTVVLQNAAGCDSTITLNLTINNSNNITDTQTACDSLLWIDGNTYTSSTNTPTVILQNATGCDSIITLDLTITPHLPPSIQNSFSMPSDANSCTGEVAVTISGNADFELDFDNGSQVITSNGYSLVSGLCAGIHDLHVTDNCGDTLSVPVVIPVDSNYVFNNPFIDSLAQDSLGVTLTNCDIYYAGIDTAYIDSIWATGNTVNVIWNIVDSNGSNFDTTSYVLNNGNGVYWLQLSVFCPFKSVGEYFTVTEAIYFNNGHVSTAGLTDFENNLFEIYPNPTNDQVHINFSGSDAELIVYDLQGKVVLKDRIQNQEIISLQNVERGVYLFDFRNPNGHSVKRVVKN
jgi:uncharacterized delta-60 repeat protein